MEKVISTSPVDPLGMSVQLSGNLRFSYDGWGAHGNPTSDGT